MPPIYPSFALAAKCNVQVDNNRLLLTCSPVKPGVPYVKGAMNANIKNKKKLKETRITGPFKPISEYCEGRSLVWSFNRDRIVNSVAKDEVKDSSSYEGGSQMGWQVMMNEELTAHQEERNIMNSPNEEEESCVVPETVADGIRNWVHSTAPRQEIGTEDTNVDGEGNGAGPPADDVTNEVDLLLRVIVSPEADTSEEEWPVDGGTGVRMRGSQTSIMLQHEELKFSKFAEEVHALGNLDRFLFLVTLNL